ncbi:MAG: hypothetical protein KF813_03795 [Trueperaceae bacterium]|nr:hypothetical protein [Trueperaceae bacterium]
MRAPKVLLLSLLLALPGLAFGQSLEGSWHLAINGQTLTITLGAQDRGSINGQPIAWQVWNGLLYIQTGDGTVTAYNFQRSGNSLTLSGGDLPSPITLTQGPAAPVGQPQSPQAGNQPGQQPGAAGGIRQELVGRWCDVSTFMTNSGGGSSSSVCIDLRTDGTYVVATESTMDAYAPGMWGGTNSSGGDSGRWTATATTITATSDRGGSATYQLQLRNNQNGDPMICLDGACYATYWQKPGW